MLRRLVIGMIALACGGCGLAARLALGERQMDAGVDRERRVFRCESRDNRRNYCPADTRHGVRLLQQRSAHACVQGSTWSYDRRAVWVARGCSADFVEGPVDLAGHAPPQTVRCESGHARTTRCNAVVTDHVALTRQLSATRCVQRQNWGWDRDGIWVNGGCSAEFVAR